LETTSLDTTRNEVLEIAAVKLGYVNDRITSVIGTFQDFSSRRFRLSLPSPP